jgi:large subunit ribosomal protein L25
MNLNTFELNFEKRNSVGTISAKALRHASKVPATIYGKGKETLSCSIDQDALKKALDSRTLFNKFTNINIDGQKMTVFAQTVQKHPVSDKSLHIDFQIVEKDSIIKMRIPVIFTNRDQCETIKLGGFLNVVCSSLELIGPAKDMPETLIVDLASAQVGISIKVQNLGIPSSIKVHHKYASKVIATILAAKKKGGQSDAEGESADA